MSHPVALPRLLAASMLTLSLIGAAIVAFGLPATAGPVLAAHLQDHDDDHDDDDHDDDHLRVASFPAHIHTGTCAAPASGSEVALTELAWRGSAEIGQVGPDDSIAWASESEVEMALNDLLASQHAIAVGEDGPGVVACGVLAGPVVDGTLVVGLRERNDSDLVGIAVLEERGDTGRTAVSVYLTTCEDHDDDRDDDDHD